MVTELNENWMPKWSQQIIKIKPLGAHGRFFGDFVRFLTDVFFYEFWVRQKVGPKSQSSAISATNSKKRGWFGRGRQERRRAGEEKELGV